MQQLFQNILTASFHGSVVIVVVILLRLVLKKTPKKFLCLLWLLAGLRLMMPFEIQSSLSLQPEPLPVAEEILWQEPAAASMPEFTELPQTPVQEDTVQQAAAVPEASAVPDAAAPVPAADPQPEKEPLSWPAMLPYFWLAVTSCFALYSVCAYVTLRRKVRLAVKIPGGYECENIETAFILGFIRPKIYIPMGMSQTVRKHILAHERTHLEKGDHWFKMVGFVALALHWFNPLVWAAYILLCKDIEMACDERVVQFMELNERKEYAAALLNCSTNRAHLAACPVAFGEVSVKYRIKSVLNYRKPSFWISMLGVIAIGFVAVCLVTSPTEDGAEPVSETVGDDGRRVVVVETVDQFLAAIGPDTEIQMAPGSYNLCEAETYGKATGTMYYSWGEVYDGYQLVIFAVENLTIKGSSKLVTTVETEPRYANVMYLQNCSNVAMEGFTAGHIKGAGECSGGVVFLEGCSDVDMTGLGLYGCGVLGLQTDLCSNVTLRDSDIYDCSSSAVNLNASTGIILDGCRIYNIGREQYGGYTFLGMTDCDAVSISNCELSDSTLMYLMNASGSRVELVNNRFTGNRARDAAFYLNGENVVLDGNQFKDNNIRQWYDHYSNFAKDRSNNPITEFQQTMTETKSQNASQEQVQIHVSTVDELIAAIGPNREIILDGEMYDFSTATGYGSTKGDYYFWEDVYDGPGLVICNVDNMTIRSVDGNVKGHTIAAIPRYADVLAFSGCSNVTLSGFTAGHTREPGSCAGGVIEFRDCDNMTVDKCGLFGCGILGVYSEYSSNITVKNSDIYECSQGGIQLRDTTGIVLENNTFRDLGGDATAFIGCANITVDGERLDGDGEWKDSIGSLTASVQGNTDTAQVPEDAKRLQETALLCAEAYFKGQKTALKELYLSADYARGEFPVYQGDVQKVTLMDISVPKDYPSDMETKGYCTVTVNYELSSEKDTIHTNMLLEMIRENGSWKVQYYTLGDTEIDMLYRDLWNFIDAYFRQDLKTMELLLADSYTRPVEVYYGDGNRVIWDDSNNIGNTFSNAQLAALDNYVVSTPFKDTKTSDSYSYLTITLQRRENKQRHDDGRIDSEWVVTDYGLEK